MKETDYEDVEGRRYRVLVQDDAKEGDEQFGIRLGPPPLTALGLPPILQTRLHNALHARGILRMSDIARRRQDVVGALMYALSIDTQSIETIYNAAEQVANAAQVREAKAAAKQGGTNLPSSVARRFRG